MFPYEDKVQGIAETLAVHQHEEMLMKYIFFRKSNNFYML